MSLLDGFFTTLVLQQDGDGIFNIYQTVVSRKADGPPSPSSLRRLEEVERLLVGGNRTRALDYADGLITSGQIDPMSGWMGAQLLFVNNRFDALDSLSRRLLDLYPKASDTHALRGAYLATRPDRLEEANTHFDKALKLGPPVLRFWLTRLNEAAQCEARGAVSRIDRANGQGGSTPDVERAGFRRP